MRDWRRASGTPSAKRGTPAVAHAGRVGATTGPGDRLAHGDLGPDDVIELQRLAGNEAATGLLHPEVQRQPPAPASNDAVYEEAAQEVQDEAEGADIVHEGEQAIAAAGEGAVAWRALPATLDTEELFILFDDAAVQRLFSTSSASGGSRARRRRTRLASSRRRPG